MDMISNNEVELPNNTSSSIQERFRKIASQKSYEKEPQETFFGSEKRKEGQRAARIGESILGFPGNIKKAFTQFKDFISPELSKMEKELGQPGKGSFQDYFFNPPTSSELREKVTPKIAKFFTGSEEGFEPRGAGERITGDVLQDLMSFYMPGTKGLRTAVRIGAPIVGNLASEGSKYLGADEKFAANIKTGTMLMTTLAGQSNPGQFASQRISQAKQMIPN